MNATVEGMKQQRWESYKRCTQLPVLPTGSWKLDWAVTRTYQGIQSFSYVAINGQLFKGATLENGVWTFWNGTKGQRMIFTDESAPCEG